MRACVRACTRVCTLLQEGSAAHLHQSLFRDPVECAQHSLKTCFPGSRCVQSHRPHLVSGVTCRLEHLPE